jgi:tetratricopeptide (TPR) repeat protein
VDTRADIYALGVLLYELLTGTTPFEKERLSKAGYDEIRRILREEEPPRPSARLSTLKDRLTAVAAQRRTEPRHLLGTVRGELDWIVMKALEKDRNRRYETADGFALDVQRYLADEPVLACPPSAGYRFRKFVRRNKGPLLAASLVVVALVAGAVGTALGLVRALAEAQEKEQARQAAVAKEGKATAVSDLLREMFGSANPDEVRGADYTVRQLLDDASAGLREQLKDQPEAEAAVRATVGNAYCRLGLPDQGEPHLQAALEIRRRLHGPEHELVAESLADLSGSLLLKRDPLAEARAREALAIYHRQGARSGKVLKAYFALQNSLFQQGKYGDLDPVARESLTFARAAGLEEHPEVANILHKFAALKNVTGRQGEAERLATEAVALHRRVHGNRHPETAFGIATLGQALQGRRKYAEAAACYQEALAIFRTQYGDAHPHVANVLSRLAATLAAAAEGDFSAEENVLTERLAAATRESARLEAEWKKQLEREADQRATVANVFREAGQPDRAEPQFRAVVDLRRCVAGRGKEPTPQDALALARALIDYATFQHHENRQPAAEALGREALEIHRKHNGRNGDTLGAYSVLLRALRRQGRHDEAVPLAEGALALARTLPAGERATHFYPHILLIGVDVKMRKNQYGEAEDLAREALAWHRQRRHPSLWAHQQLARVLRARGKHAEADEQDHRILDLLDQGVPNPNQTYSGVVEQLAARQKARGDRAALDRSFVAVRDQVGKAIAREPADVALRLCLAHACLAFDRPEEAVTASAEAIRLRPGDARPWNARGAARYRLGRNEEALADYVKASELNPGEPRYWCNRASLHARLGQHDRAVAAYREAVRLKPDDTMVWQFLGWAQYRAGAWRESIEALQKSCRLQAGTGDAGQWIVLALAHARLARQEGVPDKERRHHGAEARRRYGQADKQINGWWRVRPDHDVGQAIWDFREEAKGLIAAKDGKK